MTGSRRGLGRLPVGIVCLLLLPACVPYERYQEAEAKLNLANQLNRDLERGLREAQTQMAEFGGDSRIVRANYEALTDKYQGLLEQIDALTIANEGLKERLSHVSELQVPGFSAEDSSETGIERTSRGALMLTNELLFAPGKVNLKPAAKEKLDALANVLQTRYGDRTIYVEGHTDNTPIKNSPHADNWELGAKRAHAVFSYLLEKGIADTKMRVYSAGFAEPADGVSNVDSNDGRARCRRVEIRLGG